MGYLGNNNNKQKIPMEFRKKFNTLNSIETMIQFASGFSHYVMLAL